MSEQAPPPWFDEQTKDRQNDPAFRERKARLEEELKQFQDRDRRRGRANSFLPYLLVRSVLGDHGDRPINVPFWESPDIWTAQGEPKDTPAVPPDHGGTAVAGRPHTVYAHVWNLGLAPLAGIAVEFYWFDPSVAITGANANLIGTARCELAARGMSGSHLLVKCPKPWVPVMVNGGHECLVVRISGIGDPLGNNPWAPWLNRHIGQRNIAVVQQGEALMQLLGRLDLSRILDARLELSQIGRKQAELALAIAAPKLRLKDVRTHALAEFDLRGRLRFPERPAASPGMQAPIHPLVVEDAFRPEGMRWDDDFRVLGDLDLGKVGRQTSTRQKRDRAPQQPDIARLFEFGGLHEGVERHRPLGRGEGAALRLATYRGDQLIGGYTLLVQGPRR